jgi:ATP dependent DNA ligase domain
MTMQFTIPKARQSHELFQLAGRWSGRLWTRNGHEIHGTGHILHVLNVMERIAGEPLMLDGEFQVGGTLLATKAWCEAGWKSGGEDGTLHLFDAMPERQWRNGGCDMPLIERKERLQALHDTALAEIADDWAWREGTRGREPDAPATVVISHQIVAAARGVRMLAEEVWARGGEGLMVKDPTAAYTRGRSNAWLKVKRNGVR